MKGARRDSIVYEMNMNGITSYLADAFGRKTSMKYIAWFEGSALISM